MTPSFGPGFDAQWRRRFELYGRSSTKESDISGWSDVGLSRRVDVFSHLLDTLELPPSGMALDLGCGAGTYCRLLAKRGYRVIGVDYSTPSLRHALHHDTARACRYAAADAYALPFGRPVFDLVVCIGVLQTVGDPERLLDEAVRVLRPGGLLILEGLNTRSVAARVVRAREALYRRPPRVRLYEPRVLERWLDARMLRTAARVPIVLPPRAVPRILPLLDLVPLARPTTRRAPLTEAVAHSFLFVARLAADGATPSDKAARVP